MKHPRTMLKRPTIGLLAGVLAIAGLSACGRDERPASLTTVRVAFLQSLDQTPTVVMQERGIARARGLAVREVPATGGRAAIEAIANGEADIANAGSVPMLKAAHAGLLPTQVVAVGASSFADARHPSMALMVAPDVRGWGDLAGRTVGINQTGSLGDLTMRVGLAEHAAGSVQLTEIGFPNLGLALAGGNISGAVMPEPYVTQSLLRGDGRVLEWVIGGGSPFPTMQVGFIVVRSSLLHDHPDVVTAYLKAHFAAVAWARAHPARARALIARRLGIDSRVETAMRMPGFVADGRIDTRALAQLQTRLAAVDPTLTPLAPAQLYDTSALRRAEDTR